MRLLVIYLSTLIAAGICSGSVPLLKLNDGRSVPALGLGTWLGFAQKGGRVNVTDNSVQEAVEYAIDVGYRHIDTARIYDTEEQVGRAVNKKIADGVVKREDIFITTKLWNDAHAEDAVIPALRASLKRLGLDYVDLYLIHWPVATFENGSLADIDFIETWRGMVKAKQLGLAKSIGVSNFNEQMLDRVLSLGLDKPAMLQVEINLNLQQPALLSYCLSHGILVTGYTPFGSLYRKAPAPSAKDPRLVSAAERYHKTVAQLALRYLVELGVIPIPKSVTKSRIKENIDVFNFTLTAEDKALLKTFNTGHRTIDAHFWRGSPFYPF